MAVQCVSSIKARHMRVTRLDACGNRVVGARSVINTRGFVKIDVKSQYDAGAEIIVKNANGDFCINERDDPQLKRAQVTIDFCRVDPDTLEIVTGAALLGSIGGTGTGNVVVEGPVRNHFALEVWTLVAGTGGCTPSGQLYLYWVFPNVGGAQIGDFVFDNAALTFGVDGETHPTGPDYLGGLAGAHWGWFPTLTPPPAEFCGATAYP